MKAAGAEVVELSLPDMQQMIGGTSLYLSRSRFDVDTFLKSRPALPYSSLKDIYATGLCHKNLDLIKQGVSGWAKAPYSVRREHVLRADVLGNASV